MRTYADIIEEVSHNLAGFGALNDAMTTLEAQVDEAATTFKVTDTSSFTQGVIEIDSELIYVTSADPAAKTFTAPGWGRGHKGTNKVGHLAGAKVTIAPTMPRASIKRAIGAAIRGVYPSLWGVKQQTVTADTNQYTYPLAVGTERLLDVRWRMPGVTRQWERVRHWNTLHGQNTAEYPSGVALEIYDEIPPFAQVSITTAFVPPALDAETEDFTTKTGLAESVSELAVIGATYRLLPYLDVARLPGNSPIASLTADKTPTGSAGEAMKTFYQLYTQRLAEEKAALDARYPAHYRTVR